MTQLLLDIQPAQAPTFANFVTGGNAELVERLHALIDPQSFDMIYLWGAPGSGRSHLLKAAATATVARNRRPVVFAQGHEVGAELSLPQGALMVVDDIEALTAAGQVALFRLFNSARLAGYALLLSGPVPPLQLALREDLRTRVGQALIFQALPLADEEKAAALERHAIERGMRVDASLMHYLLRHSRRDLPTLMAILDSLDRASLTQQRSATLPLLKQVLAFEPE